MLFALLVLCDGNPSVTGWFPQQRVQLYRASLNPLLFVRSSRTSNHIAGDLRRHGAHVMSLQRWHSRGQICVAGSGDRTHNLLIHAVAPTASPGLNVLKGDLSQSKTGSHQDTNFIGIAVSHDNLRCHQCQQSRHHNNSWFSVNIRADSRLAPSQWETLLQSNAASHWLGANLESALNVIWFTTYLSLDIFLAFVVNKFNLLNECVKLGNHEVIFECFADQEDILADATENKDWGNIKLV